MKIGKTVKWILLSAICNLNAQNNLSLNFSVNTQPTEKIKTNAYDFGVDYFKTFNSKYKIANELEYNSKSIEFVNSDFLNFSTNDYIDLRNKFTFSYLKFDKIHFNFKLEPYLACKNNLKVSDIDLLGELNTDFILSSNKSLTVGVSRNNLFGKTMILPLVTYYYEYSKKLNVSVGFPETKVSYSNNSRNVFSIKNAFNGSVYNLDNVTNSLALNSAKASFSQLTSSLEYERNIDTNWFVNCKAGYDFNKKYLLLDANDNTTFDYKLKDGYNFGLTIKYKH
jgi:hypothetical protein